MELETLKTFLDSTLALDKFSRDASNNGLQVEGKTEVRSAVFGVDACQELFDAAAARGADFIFVHHGMSWGRGVFGRGFSSRKTIIISGGSPRLPDRPRRCKRLATELGAST